MSALRKRLAVLETARTGARDYSHLTDEELEERIAKVCAQLGDQYEPFPADFQTWPDAKQAAWLRVEREAIQAEMETLA